MALPPPPPGLRGGPEDHTHQTVHLSGRTEQDAGGRGVDGSDLERLPGDTEGHTERTTRGGGREKEEERRGREKEVERRRARVGDEGRRQSDGGRQKEERAELDGLEETRRRAADSDSLADHYGQYGVPDIRSARRRGCSAHTHPTVAWAASLPGRAGLQARLYRRRVPRNDGRTSGRDSGTETNTGTGRLCSKLEVAACNARPGTMMESDSDGRHWPDEPAS